MSSELPKLFASKLELSGLTLKDADKLGFEIIEKQRMAQLGHPAYGGFKIPYIKADKKHSDFYRIRYLEQTKTGFKALTTAKPLRYVQPKGTLNEVYLPPFVDWPKLCADATKPIIITEGELKAAKACKEGFACMGLGGVWNFRSAAHGIELLEFLEHGVAWEGRPTVILYDSDAATNPKVALAEHTLAKQLLKRGADVRIGRIKTEAGSLEKVGLDDLLVTDGKQALREVLDKASPFEQVQELFKLNTEVMYVRNPGIVLRLDNLQRMAPRAFTEHAYSTRTFVETVTVEGKSGAQVKTTEKSAPREWIKWPCRSEVEKVTYEPGRPRIYEGCLNVWPGWGCIPKQGSVDPWRKLMKWMFKDDDKARSWFEQWLSYPLQNPGVKLYQSSVVWGIHHGTGKSLVGYTLFRIYGANSTEIRDHNLHENHNEWAENKQFVMGDEITSGDKRGIADRMKSLITQERLRLNPKYIPSYEVRDCINYYFTSNHPDSFFLEDNDRRYFIWEAQGKPLDRSFYIDYMKWLNGAGAAALFDYFLDLDVTDFDPFGPAPLTLSKSNMIYSGKSDLGAWVSALKEDPDSVLRIDDIKFPYYLYRAEDILKIYDPNMTSRVTANGMGRELKRAGFEQAWSGQPMRTAQGQMRLWIIRKNETIRNTKGQAFGALYDQERGIGSAKRRKF